MLQFALKKTPNINHIIVYTLVELRRANTDSEKIPTQTNKSMNTKSTEETISPQYP